MFVQKSTRLLLIIEFTSAVWLCGPQHGGEQETKMFAVFMLMLLVDCHYMGPLQLDPPIYLLTKLFCQRIVWQALITYHNFILEFGFR